MASKKLEGFYIVEYDNGWREMVKADTPEQVKEILTENKMRNEGYQLLYVNYFYKQ